MYFFREYERYDVVVRVRTPLCMCAVVDIIIIESNNRKAKTIHSDQLRS